MADAGTQFRARARGRLRGRLQCWFPGGARQRWRSAAIAAAAATLSACAIGPDYERPEIVMPERFVGASLEEQSIGDLGWWELFHDPVLLELINTALENNRDLQVAAARVAEARARVGVVRGDQFPEIGIGAAFERGNTNEVLFPDSGIIESWFGGGVASYEVDLWGRYRRATEAERAALLASVENRRTVAIALIADVATTYLLVRDLDKQLAIATSTLELRRESTGIIRARFDKGVVALIDVNQAQIQEAEAAARKASIGRQLREAENLLNLLLGRNPAPVLRAAAGTPVIAVPAVPAGIPATLLDQRPDIRGAEQQLASATARIGVAQSLRFPSITLTGSLGYVSEELSDLNDGTRVWGVNVDLFAPIFDGKKRRSQVEQERARTAQALGTYEQTVLNALREVEDALAGISGYRDELAARRMQVEAARSAAELSRARYDGGVTDYLEVLDSERSLFDAELSASAVNRLQLSAIIALYRALGGGWQVDPPEPGNAAAAQPDVASN